MTSTHILAGLFALGILAGGTSLAAPAAGAAVQPGISSQDNSMVMENEYVSVEVQKVARKLAGVVVRDKINGRTYDLGEDVFRVLSLEAQTDEACSKVEYKDTMSALTARDLICGEVKREALSANPQARRLVERKAGQRITVPFVVTLDGKGFTWWAELREGQPYVRIGLDIEPQQFALPVRKITLLDIKATEARVEGSVKGAPIVASGNRLFAGVESPLCVSEATADGFTCSLERKTNLPQAVSSFSAVLGFCQPTQLRRTFQLDYVNQERARAYAPFLNYNTWYDIGYSNMYSEKDALDTIKLYGEELVKKRGVKMDSFMFDDGWDDPKTLWGFHKDLPNEFRAIRKLAESYGADPGVWFSPWGGYGSLQQSRIKAAGGKFETSERGFTLTGRKYYDHFKGMCLHMIQENGVNHFKFDGTSAEATPAPGSVFGSDFEAAISLIRELRNARPDIYINLTTGTWASPFWFGIADSIWRGEMDHDFCGEGSKRNRWITYRDSQIYRNNVKISPLFPINSLMTHGVIYNKHAHGLTTTEGDDLAKEIWSGFGLGTQMEELYITPAMLKPAEWDTLAAAAKWARANAATLVDSHWVGGNPADMEVYGFASWSPEKGIVTLRNPSSQEQEFAFDPAAVWELPVGAPAKYKLSSPKGDKLPAAEAEAGKPVKVKLAPFEVMVLEGAPQI